MSTPAGVPTTYAEATAYWQPIEGGQSYFELYNSDGTLADTSPANTNYGNTDNNDVMSAFFSPTKVGTYYTKAYSQVPDQWDDAFATSSGTKGPNFQVYAPAMCDAPSARRNGSNALYVDYPNLDFTFDTVYVLSRQDVSGGGQWQDVVNITKDDNPGAYNDTGLTEFHQYKYRIERQITDNVGNVQTEYSSETTPITCLGNNLAVVLYGPNGTRFTSVSVWYNATGQSFVAKLTDLDTGATPSAGSMSMDWEFTGQSGQNYTTAGGDMDTKSNMLNGYFDIYHNGVHSDSIDTFNVYVYDPDVANDQSMLASTSFNISNNSVDGTPPWKFVYVP